VVEDADALFFALPLPEAGFVLLVVLRGPLARVLAALLRLLAVVLPEAMVFAAWVLAEAVGFFAVEEAEVFFALPLFAAGVDFVLLAVLRVLLLPLARVLAALLRAEALLLLARVLAALLLLAVLLALAGLLVGICVSLL